MYKTASVNFCFKLFITLVGAGSMSSTTPAAASAPSRLLPDRCGKDAVFKFGYGSNMSQDNLRSKKGLNPLDFKRTILKGFRLSFLQVAASTTSSPTLRSSETKVPVFTVYQAFYLSKRQKDSTSKRAGTMWKFALRLCMVRMKK